MAGSIITIFRWSIWKVSSAALIVLWAFNPLGFQASFRGGSLRPNTGSSHAPVTFYNPNLTSQIWLTQADMPGNTRLLTRAVFSSAIYDYVASIQYVDPTQSAMINVVAVLGGGGSAAVAAAMDTWGNARIPSLEYHPDYNRLDPNRWLNTSWTTHVMNYSSLVGIRVDGIDRSLANTSFQMQSSYGTYKVRVPLRYTMLYLLLTAIFSARLGSGSTSPPRPGVPTIQKQMSGSCVIRERIG